MRSFHILVLAACLIVLPWMATPARALERTVLWDTNAEFDAGLKSNSSGHRGVETYTDNPLWRETNGPLTGLFASGLRGDHFVVPDFNAETWKLEKPVASDCTDDGAEWIATNDPTFSYTSPSSGLTVNEVLDTTNGAMVFMHNTSGRESTRTTTALLGAGQYWKVGTDLRPSMWGIANFTFVMSNLSPGDSSTQIWCGGLNATVNPNLWAAGFYLRKTVTTDVGPGLFALQPFMVRAGVASDCGSRSYFGAGAIIRPRMERAGNEFTFSMVTASEVDVGPNPLPVFFGTCSNNVTQAIQMYGTFDFGTTSGIGGAILVHLYKQMLHTIDPVVFGYAGPGDDPAFEPNWTSANTGGNAADRPFHVKIRFFTDDAGDGSSLCGFALLDDVDWTAHYQPAQWNVCTAPDDGFVIWESDVGTIAADGPYRFRFGVIGDQTFYTQIISVEVNIRYEPTFEEGDGQGPPAILAPMTGGLMFCGVGVAIVVVFLGAVRKVKG